MYPKFTIFEVTFFCGCSGKVFCLHGNDLTEIKCNYHHVGVERAFEKKEEENAKENKKLNSEFLGN